MIICADDFGISKSVSDGILELLYKKRLTAVSCMLNYDGNIINEIDSLLSFNSICDIGLHLNLTSGKPLSSGIDKSSGLVDKHGNFLNFKKLLKNILFKKVNIDILSLEIEKQINYFLLLTKKFPDFVDGHQHIQQLPIIRNLLPEICSRIFENKNFYIRVGRFPIKQSIIHKLKPEMILGSCLIDFFSTASIKQLDFFKIKFNNYLLGYYNYNKEYFFEKVFEHYLKLNTSKNDIFFTHPGYIDQNLIFRDTLIEGRKTNLEFLLSNKFEDLLGENEIKINKFNY